MIVLDKDRPRIFHEYSNDRRDIRAFVVLFVDGFLLCGRGAAGRVAAGEDG